MNGMNPKARRRLDVPPLRGGARRSVGLEHGNAEARGKSGVRGAAPLLLVGSAVSSTSGSAIAVQLFTILGPVGTLWIRNVLAALILVVFAGRSFRRPPRNQVLRLAALGVTLAACNMSFYEALNRVPLSVATTVEFLGPLAIAVAGTRKVVDLAWVVLASVPWSCWPSHSW